MARSERVKVGRETLLREWIGVQVVSSEFHSYLFRYAPGRRDPALVLVTVYDCDQLVTAPPTGMRVYSLEGRRFESVGCISEVIRVDSLRLW